MAEIQLKNGIQLPSDAIKFYVSAPIDNGIEPKVPISFVQYDSGLIVVAFNILKDNQVYIPPEDAKIWVRMNKPDGHGVYMESLGADDSGTVYFIVPQQMTTMYGTGELSLELNTTEGQKNTKTVPVYISKNPIQDEQIKSTDDFKTLYDILIYVMSVEALINKNQDALTFIKENQEQLTILVGMTNEIKICAENSESIITTANNISDVNTVSTNIEDVKNVSTNIGNINSVADNEANINTVANNNDNVTTVATSINNVNNVSENIEIIKNVDSNKENINIVADNKSNIDTVANNTSNINNVSENIDSVNSVSENIDSVNNVSTNMENINSVITNMEDIKNAPAQAQIAIDNATLSKSWAVGGTGTREGEDTNNAEYWAKQSAAANNGYLGIFETKQGLKDAYPTSESGKFAIVKETGSVWYWDTTNNEWTNTNSEYNVLLEITNSSWTLDNEIYKRDFVVESCTENTLITNVEIAKENGTEISILDRDLASTIFDYAETFNGKITLYASKIPSESISLYFSLTEI